MKQITNKSGISQPLPATALECNFPLIEISQIAEQESWRKEINRPIYHIHKWWATRLGSVFRGIVLGALSKPETDTWSQFYKTHNLKGKVVLDPFMGSGTTLGEAVKLGAKAIGCDINPVSTFLVRQAFTPAAEQDLRTAFERLEHQVAPEIQRYYKTRDPETGELIQVLYYFWVKTVTTPEGEVIPLLSRYVFSQWGPLWASR
jgi:putative DNA methylase